ncbi:hypothetical protein M5D96_005029, partial [Drosophila gunungcola]
MSFALAVPPSAEERGIPMVHSEKKDNCNRLQIKLLKMKRGSAGPEIGSCWHCNASDIGRRRCFHFNINFTPKQQTGPRTQKSYCQ